MAIWFSSEIEGLELKKKRDLKSWIKATLNQYKLLAGTINYIFVDKDFIIKLNRQFLSHNYFTDIITFEYPGNKKLVSGDIYICYPVVMENAGNFNASVNEELKRVMIHGILHLAGLSDHTDEERAVMRKKEDIALQSVKDLLII